MGRNTTPVSYRRMLLVVGSAFTVGAVLFPLLTVTLGYGMETAWVCLLVLGAAGYLGLRGERLSVAGAGGSLRHCLRAIVTMLVAYGSFCLLLIIVRRYSLSLLATRLSELSPYGWFDNWVITGFSGRLAALVRKSVGFPPGKCCGTGPIAPAQEDSDDKTACSDDEAGVPSEERGQDDRPGWLATGPDEPPATVET